MRQRAFTVFVALMLLVPVAGVAVAQETTPTPAPTDTAAENDTAWSAPGPFSMQELKTGGTHDPDAPKSVRTLKDPQSGEPYGSVAVRYNPVSPLDNSYKFLKPDQQLQTDTIQFYTTAFGEATGDYEAVIVYWQQETKRVNGTTRTYAANQTVQRVDLEVDEGYATVDVSLRSQYDKSWQATMWLERDGERVDGARWRFQHKSNPLTAAPAFAINSQGDLWRWGGVNILLPGALGIVLASRGAKHFLSKTIIGPQMGTGFWVVSGTVIALIAAAAATWQTASVLSRAPWVAGGVLALLAFIVYLGSRDPDVEQVEFNKRSLENATDLDGEDTVSTRKVFTRIENIVRRNNSIYMPAEGIRPWLARYWADPAKVDESQLKTADDVEGDLAKKYEVEPQNGLGENEILVHKPARLAFSPTILHPQEDGVEKDRPDGVASLPYAVADIVGDTVDRLNWSFLAPAFGGFAVIYVAINAYFGTPSLGVLLGVLPGLIAGHEARDGELEVEMAPYHYSRVRAILSKERATYTEAKTWDEMLETIGNIEVEGVSQAEDMLQTVRKQIREEMEDRFSIPDAQSPDTESTGGVPGDD